MGAENFGSTSVGGKRTAKRARVLLAARLETARGEIDARLRDLSQKGALIECKEVPPWGLTTGDSSFDEFRDLPRY